MKKSTKVWIILGSVWLLAGIVLLGGALISMGFDLSKLSASEYETNEYKITEGVRNISVKTNTANVEILPSDGENVTVICYEEPRVKHNVKCEEGTLYIEVEDTRKWYEHIGVNFGTAKITVSIPAGEYGSLSVKNSTGHVDVSKDFTFSGIEISLSTGKVTNRASSKGLVSIKTSAGSVTAENFSATAIDITVTTGMITVRSVNCAGDITLNATTGKVSADGVGCKNFRSKADTGRLSLSSVTASEDMRIERSTGDVKLERCDAGDIYIITDTGDVSGTLLSEKVFITKTDTGKINVPSSITGGRCEISTDTGDIKIEIAK